MPLFGKKDDIPRYKAKYIGGHSLWPKSKDVRLELYPDYLAIPEFGIQLPYAALKTVQNMTKDKLTAKRFLLVGLLAFAWKKQQLFMILSFEDAPGLEQNPTFAVDKIEEVQPMIYHKMISART